MAGLANRSSTEMMCVCVVVKGAGTKKEKKMDKIEEKKTKRNN